MTAILRDLRHATRVLLGTKGWTAVVLLSLALGIGANTALFTAVNQLLLETVSVPEPGRLVRFAWTGQNDMVRSSSDYGFSGTDTRGNVRSTFSFPMFEALKAANSTLTDLTAGLPAGQFNVTENGHAEFASAFEASGNYFQVLGVPAAIGRVFGETDDTPASAPVAVISHAYWRKRFAGDPSVVNRTVPMNGHPVTIIGVLPAWFTGIQQLGSEVSDIFVPLSLDETFSPPTPLPNQTVAIARRTQATYWWLQLVGRLRPGATLEGASANFTTVFQTTARAGMQQYQSGLSAAERSLTTNRQKGDAVPALLVRSAAHGVYEINPQSRRSAGFLSVVVVIVLLIVCANVANLLLSRASTRQREISVRLSVGATRGRLVRQLLTESLLLSGVGGGLGVLVAIGFRSLLPFGNTAPINWSVIAFVAGVSLTTGVIFGLVPALRATRLDLASSMKETGRSVTAGRNWLSRGLLVAQVAMSLVLVIGAGLFLRTLANLKSVDVGFNSRNLLTFSVNSSANGYAGDRAAALYARMTERLSALPGVQAVTLTRTLLLSGSTSTSWAFRAGQTSEKATVEDMYMMDVAPTFFSTMQIPILRGRTFSDHDTPTTPKVTILNEAAARLLYPEGDALGRRIGGSFEKSGEFEIIGIVRDTKYDSVRTPGPPTMYRALGQSSNISRANVVIRTAGEPLAMSEAVRTAVREIDATLPIQRFTSQTEQIEQRFAQERLFATAYTFFGALALLLACIGLFGLMSYSVSRRVNEIGIRMALGAQRSSVVRMILGEALFLVSVGVVLGIGGALWARKFVASVLFDVSPTDVPTMLGAIGLIVFIGALAGFLPARRASRVDPLIALQQQ